MRAAFLLLLALWAAHAYNCSELCGQKYDYWMGVAQTTYDARGYYTTIDETNCWPRDPESDSDPCWDIDCEKECAGSQSRQNCMNSCDMRLQECCLESARVNAVAIEQECNMLCNRERRDPECRCEFYEVDLGNCTCRMDLSEWQEFSISSLSGTVDAIRYGQEIPEQTEPGLDFELGDSIITGSDGTATVMLVRGRNLYEIKIGPAQFLKSITYGEKGGWVQSMLTGDIKDSGISSLNATAVIAPDGERVLMRVREQSLDGSHIPIYKSFGSGYVSIVGEGDEAEYELRNAENGVTVVVSKGSVRVGTSIGGHKIVQAGQSATLSPSSIGDIENTALAPCLALVVLSLSAIASILRGDYNDI